MYQSDSPSIVRSRLAGRISKAAARRRTLRRATASVTPRVAGFEPLESRQLLSGTVTIAGAPTTTEGADYALSLSSQGLSSPIDHWTINWGDGTSTVPGSASTADHFYADGPNNFTINASATLADTTVVQANLSQTTVTQDGSLDSAFGTSGQVLTSLTGSNRGMVVQSNGQIIDVSQNGTTAIIARFNSDGSADQNFGTSGTTSLSGVGGVAKVLLQTVPNPYGAGTVERLVIVGSSNSVLPHSVVWRFNLDNGAGNPADGTPDAAFGTGGEFDLPPTPSTFIAANDVAVDATLDSQQRIVILAQANRFQNDPVPSVSIARVLADGSGMDTSFNGTGFQTNQLNNTFSNNNNPLAVLTEPDDSVLALTQGETTADPTGRNYFMRFTPTGGIDTSFGPSGFVAVNHSDVTLTAMAFDGAGHILLTGGSNNGQSVAVARYNLDGTSDTFGSDGLVTVALETNNSFSGGTTIAPAAGGQIIVGGVVGAFFTGPFNGSNAFVARFNANGTLDTTFGGPNFFSSGAPTGVRRLDFANGADSTKQVIVLADGAILMTGNSSDPSNHNFVTLAQLGIESAASAPVTVGVANAAPTAAISAVGSSNEGAAINLTGSATDPGTIDQATGFSYSWSVSKTHGATTTSFASGSTAAGAATAAINFTPDDDGTYVVTLTATDKDGATSSAASESITVANVAPTPSITAPTTGSEGTAISVSGSATDPSSADTTAGFTFGWTVKKNGSPFSTGAGAGFTFTPDDNGNYVVILTATDKDGGVGNTSSGTIVVANVAPTPTINSAPTTGSEGSAISVSGSATDPSSADTAAGLTLAWSVTKNSSTFGTGALGSNFTFTPDDNGVYVVTLTATDKDGGSNSISKTINVSNVSPTVAAITTPANAVRYQNVALASSFTDPGTLDTHTVTWNFGDGSPLVTSSLPAGVTGPVSANHAFTAAGAVTITLTITDKDGGSGTVTRSFTVDIADIQTDPADPTKTALFVGGTPGSDIITVNTVGSGITATVNCDVISNLHPTGRVVVFGGDGDDIIQVGNGVGLPTELYGGNGNDLIKGDNANNIIVGGAGDDLLVGGTGRDILIGGAGNDVMVTGAGDDVLIAMSTIYDANPTALESIQKEWARTDLAFTGRVNHLTAGGGFNGTNVLTSATTFNDNATDLLSGGGGSDLFVVSAGDIITDAGKTDKVVDLSWVTM